MLGSGYSEEREKLEGQEEEREARATLARLVGGNGPRRCGRSPEGSVGGGVRRGPVTRARRRMVGKFSN